MSIRNCITAAAAASLCAFAYAQEQPVGSSVYGPVDPEAEIALSSEPYVEPDGIPLPLVQAVSVASRTHPVVQRAVAEQRASEADLRGARWQRFPSVSVEALAVSGGSQTAAQNGLAANLIVEQPLYTFGRIGGTIEAAQASLESSTSALSDSQMEIALRTTTAYFDLALATQREIILQQSLAEHNELLATIARRVEQEVSPRADLELAGSRVAQIEQELAAVAGLRSTSFAQLQELVGYAELDFGSVPEFNPNVYLPTEGELVDAALECSPRLEALQALRKEVEAERRVARSRLFPQLVAQGSTNEVTGTRFGVALRLQTGNGLSQFAAVESAEASILSAEFELASAEREIRQQIRSDYLTYEAGKSRALASDRATRSAAQVTESYKRQFITGRRTWLDVMNAVREAQSALLTEADAQLGAQAAFARLNLRSCLWKPAPVALENE